MEQLKDYLLKTHQFKENQGSSPISVLNVVMCNEACDLDSAVSAITYAYLLQSTSKNLGFGNVIPLINTVQKDFSLKTEVDYWLKKFTISEDNLLFRDTFGLSDIANSGNLNLHLVDHNVLPASDVSFEPYVVSVIDHHQLERTDTPVYGMTVEPVGSCCTLITQQIVNRNPDIMDDDVAYLLYGTILLDTVNLSASARRATPKDVSMVEYLETFLSINSSKRSEIFNELRAAKTDISHLSSEQILRKDMKLVSANNISIAMSSVPLLVQKFLERENIEEVVNQFLESFFIDILVIMGIDISGNVQRELAVISHRRSLREEISSHLLHAKSNILGLEPFETSVTDCKAFTQSNHVASRKVVLPIIKEWVESKR